MVSNQWKIDSCVSESNNLQCSYLYAFPCPNSLHAHGIHVCQPGTDDGSLLIMPITDA